MALYGGAEIVIVRLAKYLMSHGHNVSILTLSTAAHEDYQGLHFLLPGADRCISYHVRGMGLSTFRQICCIYRELKRLVRARAPQYDVINPHNFPAAWVTPPGMPAVWLCNEVPDVWHNVKISPVVNAMVEVGRYIDRFQTNRTAKYAVVADRNNAAVFEKRYGWKPDIIPYGIDGDFFHAADGPRETAAVIARLGIVPPGFNVIHPAMISPSKEQQKVLEAVDALKKEIPEIRVIFAGFYETDHPYVIRLRRYIERHDLTGRVVFTGQVTRARLKQLYGVSSVAVFPGQGQGSWLGPFEALSAGVPVVVSRKLPCAALVEEQDLGIITDDIAAGIRTVYANYPSERSRARKGCQYVLENLTWERFCSRFTDKLQASLHGFSLPDVAWSGAGPP
jgi:glycosyltransferase involved in cell wall biosynthesis